MDAVEVPCVSSSEHVVCHLSCVKKIVHTSKRNYLKIANYVCNICNRKFIYLSYNYIFTSLYISTERYFDGPVRSFALFINCLEN